MILVKAMMNDYLIFIILKPMRGKGAGAQKCHSGLLFTFK